MGMSDALDRGRESFRRREWGDAYTQLAAADREAPLGLDDLERLAVAAYLAGDDAASTDAWVRAHQDCVRAGDPARAVRCAFWLVLGLMLRGELAPAAGWLARGQRFAGDVEGHAEEGCLLLGDAVQLMFTGDAEGANAMYSRAAEIGVRFGDPDVTAMARLGEGQTAIMLGRTADGLTLLDEAMVAVTAEETSPMHDGTRLLRRDRDVPGDLRRSPRTRVDDGVESVVRVATRARAVPRPVPRASGRDPGAAGGLARRDRRGPTRLRAPGRAPAPGGRPGVLPAWRAPASAG